MKKLFFIFGLTAFVASGAEVKNVKVVVLDGFGGDVSSVSMRCQTRAGSEYDPVTITRDVETLKDSDEFETVDADAQRTDGGVDVSFYIRRKMRFTGPIVVEGNEFFKESRIAKEAALNDGYLYGEGDFAAAAARVKDAYEKKHFHDVKVAAVAEPTGDGRCHVRFLVEEGVRAKVKGVVFRGVSTEEIDLRALSAAVGDYPWWNPIGWFSDQLSTGEQQVQGCDRAAEFYRNLGYLDVKVTGPEREFDEDGACNLVYTVVEGVRYRIGQMSITGLTRYDEADVRAKSELPETGSVAGEKTITEAAHRVEIAVGSGKFGLADSRVDVRRIVRPETPGVVDLVFKVTEGVPVVINEVKIRGNDYTKDKVIRREIDLGPGDLMLADRAERSQKHLQNLNYFSRVNYSLERSDKGLDANGAEWRDLVYEVEEKNTGSFMVGVGASSVDSVYLSAEVSQANFDLFAPQKLFRGAGQKGRLFAAWGPRYQSFEASVTEPHLFGRILELTVEGYRRLRWYDEFDLIRSGASASLSYPVKFWPTWNPFGRFGVRISGEMIEFDDVDDDDYEYGGEDVSLVEEERRYGDAFEPVVRLFWGRDTRDNVRLTTRGTRTQLFADLAAGDNEYWRLGVNHRRYYTTWKRYDHVLMLAFRAETIEAVSDDVPIYNRMFLGGPRSVRGIEYRNVSPLARNTDSDHYVPWGGQTLFCMNAEYTMPIVKMLRFAVFTDIGSVGEDAFDFDFSDTLAWTVGIGFRLDVPMFPIRLDFATPIEKPDHADEEVFSFTVGYEF